MYKMDEQEGNGSLAPTATHTPYHSILETTKVVLQALAIALLIRTFLFQPFNIPSGSMIPSLEIGDYIFVSKYAYGYSYASLPFAPRLFTGRLWGAEPQRGDVVVFKLPGDKNIDYVKRVIGLPGDTIQVLKGRLYINGQIVPREPVESLKIKGRDGHEMEVPTYREILPNGVTHTIIEMEGDMGYYDNTPLYKVPQGHYFMMGDNRDNSTDSRVPSDREGVGFVPYDNIVGRSEITFLSVKEGYSLLAFWSWPWSMRFERVFHLTH